MFLSNSLTLIQLINLKTIRFFLDIIKVLQQDDPNFSFSNMVRAILNAGRGEKLIKFGNKFVISSFIPPVPSKAFMNNVLAARENTRLFSQQMKSQRSAPISMFISVTNQCPYNCQHCSAKNRKVSNELTTDQWKTVINDLQDMGTSIIGFTGGEPLLRDDLEEIISSIDERTTPLLFTNGKDLSLHRVKALKKKGLFGIAVSLDSHVAEEHNQLRRNDHAFHHAIQAIQNTRKAGLYTMINSLVLRKNIDKTQLFNLFKFANQLGVHEIRLLEPIKSGCYFDKEDSDIFYKPDDRQKLIDIQYAANRRWDMPKITTFAYTERFDQYGCGAGTQHSYITPDGTLLPCDFVPLSFGNVTERSIKELWKSMNEAIGIPKNGCFAFTLNNALLKYRDELPVSRETSIRIAREYQSNEFPKFYRLMQGRE